MGFWDSNLGLEYIEKNKIERTTENCDAHVV